MAKSHLEALVAMMSQSQNGLPRSEYLRLRNAYLPNGPKIIFVLESPPKSGLYFYNSDGRVSEPLFSAMMKDVLEIEPRTKHEGLIAFAANGFLLIDATYTPVNHSHLSERARDALILADLPVLIEELQKYAAPETKVILVKANICRQLERPLTDRGFAVLNHGTIIPFPSNGQQGKFRESVRRVLGLTLTQ
jgi:hypothetical protein